VEKPSDVVFSIDGGAGRVISSIPALLKFAKKKPENNFKINEPYKTTDNWYYYAFFSGFTKDKYFDVTFWETLEGDISIKIEYTTDCTKEIF